MTKVKKMAMGGMGDNGRMGRSFGMGGPQRGMPPRRVLPMPPQSMAGGPPSQSQMQGLGSAMGGGMSPQQAQAMQGLMQGSSGMGGMGIGGMGGNMPAQTQTTMPSQTQLKGATPIQAQMAPPPPPTQGVMMKKGGAVKKMAKGGMTDTAQDKAMIKKAFKQHDAQEHKGSKGTSLKLAAGGSFRSSANGVAQRGKTKGTMVKMKSGGKAC